MSSNTQDETKNSKDDSSMNKPAGLSEKEFPPPLAINPPESNTSGPRIREGLRPGYTAPRPIEQLPLPEFQVSVSPSPNLNQAAEQQVTAEQQITASSSAAIARPASSHVASINPTPIVPQRWGQDVINDVNSRIHSARREHGNLSILQAISQIYEQIVDEMLAPLESLSSEYPSFPVDEISERFRYIKELVRRAEEEFDKEGK
ncbi:MAG: hypothetical protein M1822_000051 [Bathelium mastoideum]|nr:MAG: hypothetical protein M1822_000051 [Bathelium mastoideum]